MHVTRGAQIQGIEMVETMAALAVVEIISFRLIQVELNGRLRVVEQVQLNLGIEAVRNHYCSRLLWFRVLVVDGGVTQDSPELQISSRVGGEFAAGELAVGGLTSPPAELLNEQGDRGLPIGEDVLGVVAGLEVVDGVPEGFL